MVQVSIGNTYNAGDNRVVTPVKCDNGRTYTVATQLGDWGWYTTVTQNTPGAAKGTDMPELAPVLQAATQANAIVQHTNTVAIVNKVASM